MLNNPLLEDLEGLSNLKSVGTVIDFGSLPGLKSLNGLRNLASTGTRRIAGAGIQTLAGLGKLVIAEGGELNLQENEALASLSGLSDAPIAPRTVFISAAPLLTDLSGLDGVTDVTDTLYISN